MITKETNSNKSSYLALYQKVTDVLNSSYVTGADVADALANCDLPTDKETGKVLVTSIAEYFSVIQVLASIVKYAITQKGYDASLYNDKLFIIPFDENDFEIDANTRKIGIPQAFSRNGIGVEGDHFVETLYFTIDRYFDTIDFARGDVRAIIEWVNGNNEKCYSPAWTKVLDDDSSKVVIGWVITDKATAKAGTIKFSVRLYTLDDNGTSITSSFATLITSVVINPSMNFDLLSADKDKVESELLKTSDLAHAEVFKRFKASPAANRSKNDVPWPEYVARYVKLDANGKISDAGNYNIEDADAGDIYYVWAKSNQGSINYSWTGTFDQNGAGSEYVPVTFWDEEANYYTATLKENGDYEYNSAAIDSAADLKAGDYYALMGKAQIPAATDAENQLRDVTGSYNCIAKNNIYGYTRPEDRDEMLTAAQTNEKRGIGIITVKGPEKFNVSLANDAAQETGATLTVVDENKNDRATTSYSWQFRNFGTDSEYVTIDEEKQASVATSNEGYWKAVVTHTKNGATQSTESNAAIIYEPIAQPVFSTVNPSNKDFALNGAEDVSWAFTVSGNYNKYSYQWYSADNTAQPNSTGDCMIKDNEIIITLSSKDMPSVQGSSLSYYPKIMACKTIGDNIGTAEWTEWDGQKKYLRIDIAPMAG